MPRAKPALPPFARRLAELRERRGWTVYRLAQECGMTRTALGNLESGRSVPSWDTVQALAQALGCRPNDFE